MRFVRFIDIDGEQRYGINPDGATAELIEGNPLDEWHSVGETLRIRTLLSPIEPPNIYGIGLNYREHAIQMGVAIPQNPIVFMKPTTALSHYGAPIVLPKCTERELEVDFECELAVVIGNKTRDVAEQEALDYVFGYTVANDVTARKWVKSSRTKGKGFDGFCPLGPMLVSADEIADPQSLGLCSIVNGKIMQQGNTKDMIFSIAKLISYVSQDTTLLPGTVILTGTPPGSGVGRNPQVFLKNGDQVTVEVEQVGTLSNQVTQEFIHEKSVA